MVNSQDLTELEEEIRDRIISQIERLEKNATPDNSIFVEIGDMELFRRMLSKRYGDRIGDFQEFHG